MSTSIHFVAIISKKPLRSLTFIMFIAYSATNKVNPSHMSRFESGCLIAQVSRYENLSKCCLHALKIENKCIYSNANS